MDKITHIHLKGPLIKAAKALIPEKPTGLGWYKNNWAFLFNNNPSKRVLQVAQKTGFTVNKDGCQTIIALPHVKEYEIKKATQRFDIFAEEYKNISKKVASIINRSINEDHQIVKTIKRGNKMADIRQKRKELDKKKEEWLKEIKHFIGNMEKSFGKIEKQPFDFDIDLDTTRVNFHNNYTGNLQADLDKMKEIFKKAEVAEKDLRTEESDKNAKTEIKWAEYQKAVNFSLT